MFNSCLIDTLSIEIFENQIFSSDFTPIRVYMFGLSFLTTLNIYKDYFKGRYNWCKWVQLDSKFFHNHIVTKDNFPYFIFLI